MLKAPFPYFGGKSMVSDEVWSALGDVEHYVEPFAGSLAVLLGRPTAPRVETVNDKDAYIVNFWRALQHDPAQVAHYANNPVNESDLTARHIWLVNTGRERLARLEGDPEYYDAKVAGWWVWGINCWIGSGWCAANGPWGSVDGKLTNIRSGGVWKQLVNLKNKGQGVNRQLVHLGDAGQGVNRQRVHLGNSGQGVNTGEQEILTYLNTLAERLRYVRVCCGDWQRVCTNGALSYGTQVGIFLDPPYDTGIRDATLYNHEGDNADGTQISVQVRQWCIYNQDNPRYRIVLAGYEGEHDMPGWTQIAYKVRASYQSATSKNNENGNAQNRHKERIWLSPNCLRNTARSTQHKLFD